MAIILIFIFYVAASHQTNQEIQLKYIYFSASERIVSHRDIQLIILECRVNYRYTFTTFFTYHTESPERCNQGINATLFIGLYMTSRQNCDYMKVVEVCMCLYIFIIHINVASIFHIYRNTG